MPPTDDALQVISYAVSILSELPGLCRKNNRYYFVHHDFDLLYSYRRRSINVVPSVLALLLGLLKLEECSFTAAALKVRPVSKNEKT